MISAEMVRALVDEDEALRTGTVTIIEGAALPMQRNLPGPAGGRLSSKEGVAVAEQDYEGWGWM
jgi:hypothetical protein